MNESNVDKTIKHESLPPVSSGSHGRGEELLQTGMMKAPANPGLVGQMDRFQVERVLGEGGMGQVLLAREPVTDALVAIKIIKPEFVKENWAIHRFLTEARHMYKMSHPGILRVIEVSDRKEGPYFVMPYLTGGSLAERIKPGEPLPADMILTVAQSIAGALDYAHGKGIIHRDLKPSNVLMDAEGRAYLTDFGLLRTVFNDSMVDVTKDRIEGTLPYMSPAVAEGKAEDTRCDIYAFGCLLYEMLTGNPPYQGPTVDNVLKQIAVGPPKPIRTLNPRAPQNLVTIAEGCMARELRNRYATMADVVSDLDRVSKGKAPHGPREQVGLSKGINLRRLSIAVTVSFACVALAIGLWQVAPKWFSNGSVTRWQATLDKAATAYDENRFEQAVGLFDAALAAMNADQGSDQSVRMLSQDRARQGRSLARFVLDRSKLPLPQQIELTQQKLSEFNTNYTGKGTFTVTKEGQIIADLEKAKAGITVLTPLKGLPLASLDLGGNPVADISPLRGMKLEALCLSRTLVEDLAPLQGMPLESLNLDKTPVSDLRPLKGIPLKNLSLWFTGVSDLTPLQGMPLEDLRLDKTRVSDLRPLKGMPLKSLDLVLTRVSDLAPLKGMSLKRLLLKWCFDVTDISSLRGMPLDELNGVDTKLLLTDLYTALRTNGLARAKQEADALIADCQSAPAFANVVTEAREIQTALAQLAKGDAGPYAQYWLKHLKERGIDRNNGYQCDTNGLITLDLRDLLVSSNATLDSLHYVPLRTVVLGGNNLSNLQALAGLPLSFLDLDRNPVADLSPLRGMQLEVLELSRTRVEDLAPLRGMPLKKLNLWLTKVIDLSPLTGMTSLTDLDCCGIPGRDLSPLRGMPLKSLILRSTQVLDLAPLQGMPLEILVLDGTPVSDIRPLTGMLLSEISMAGTKVADLAPLKGMPLKTLALWGANGVVDLSPLKGMTSLTWLDCNGTRVRDLGPLQGMPLKNLYLVSTEVADLSPLKGLSLSKIAIGNTKVSDLSPLQGMKSLTAIEGFDVAALLLADLRRAAEAKDNAAVKTLATKLIADWEDVPAIADVVRQAKEMLQAVGGRPTAVWNPATTSDVAPKPGEEKVIDLFDGVTMQLLWIPPTTSAAWKKISEGKEYFPMGAPGARHAVTLTRGFWLARTEVTQAQWEQVMGGNPSGFKGKDLPVENVNWEECRAFLGKLAVPMPGWKWALPTEAQWEYACRAGTNGPSVEDLDTIAWYTANSDGKTHPVGAKKPNAWGFCDMVGNVWEWCSDWHVDDLGVNLAVDPQGPPTGDTRLARGGCYSAEAYRCNSAHRWRYYPHFRSSNIGLRPALVPDTASSPEATKQEPFTYTTNNGTITIAKYTGPGGDVTIPSTLDGLPVTSIGDGAFAGTSLTGVMIPGTVTELGVYSFLDCGRLTRVTIPTSVTRIAPYTFKNCSSLASVTIPAGVTRIEHGAFRGCGSLTNVVIPSGVTYIGRWAFSGCSKLPGIVIPASVTELTEAFSPERCDGLTSIVVDVANRVYSSADGVLFNKDKTALLFCPVGKTGNFKVPSTVTKIGDCAFEGCDGLTGVVLPNSVTSIGGKAFKSCTNLTNITLSPGLTDVSPEAFGNCVTLPSLTIPAQVTNIGDRAFWNCPQLNELHFNGAAPSTGQDVFGGGTAPTIYYRPGTTGWDKEFGGRPTAVWNP